MKQKYIIIGIIKEKPISIRVNKIEDGIEFALKYGIPISTDESDIIYCSLDIGDNTIVAVARINSNDKISKSLSTYIYGKYLLAIKKQHNLYMKTTHTNGLTFFINQDTEGMLNLHRVNDDIFVPKEIIHEIIETDIKYEDAVKQTFAEAMKLQGESNE